MSIEQMTPQEADEVVHKLIADGVLLITIENKKISGDWTFLFPEESAEGSRRELGVSYPLVVKGTQFTGEVHFENGINLIIPEITEAINRYAAVLLSELANSQSNEE